MADLRYMHRGADQSDEEKRYMPSHGPVRQGEAVYTVARTSQARGSGAYPREDCFAAIFRFTCRSCWLCAKVTKGSIELLSGEAT
eukprot:3931333-Pyramimonas_sp.AAC.2